MQVADLFDETISQNSPDNFDYSFALKRAPLDSEGYIKAFPPSQLKEAKEFFTEFGFTVIENALTSQQCEATIDDIWTYIEEEKWKPRLNEHILQVKRSYFPSWFGNYGWPICLSTEGILGNPPVFTKQALQNRMNKVLFEIGKLFYESEEIIISQDRYGLFRPVKKLEDRLKSMWLTDYNIHLDMNPWNYFDKNRIGGQEYFNNYSSEDDFIQEFNSTGHFTDKNQMKLQALYNFIDNKEEDGGFQVIPGMHKHLKEWTEFTENSLGISYKNSSADFIPIFWKSSFGFKDVLPDKEKFKGIGKFAQRVTARAGSLIVWSQFLPHGSAPNYSENLRMAQFMKIGLASQIKMESRLKRAKYVSNKIQEAGLIVEEEFEKKLMGIDILSF